MSMNRVSIMEVVFLSVAVTVSTAVMFTPYFAAQVAGQDAWISVLVSGLLAVIPAWAAGTLMNHFPQQSIIQALPKIFGRILGTLVALMFAAYFIFAAALALWRLEVFTVRFLLTETPQLAIRTLFLLCVALAAFSGTTPLIRTSAYIVPVGVLVIILVIGLPISRMNPTFLFPVFESGYRPMINAAIMLLGWICQVPLVIMMFQRYVQAKFLVNSVKKIILGVVISTFALELGAAGTLAAFGPIQTASMFYPAFEVARIISVGAFFERIEVIFIGVWIAGILVTAAFYVQAFGDSIAQIVNFRGKSAKMAIYVSTILLLISWPLFFDLSFLQIIAIIRDYGSVAGIAMGGILPLIMLARVVIVPIGQKNQAAEPGSEEDDNGQSNGIGNAEGEEQS